LNTIITEKGRELIRGVKNDKHVNKHPTRCSSMQQYADIYLFTAKSLYMFRVSHHPSSGVLKTVTAASGAGHVVKYKCYLE
jgi:hypothetical protein